MSPTHHTDGPVPTAAGHRRPRREVLNRHVRRYAATPSAVGALLDSLATEDDRLWPDDRWPRMRLDRPLGVGASGGHGPVRYDVAEYEPGRWVRFRFRAPAGFHGHHEFTVVPQADGDTVLEHELRMRPAGPARLTWPLMFRWLHDALMEDCLDRAHRELGLGAASTRWSPWVRALRGLVNAPRRIRGATRRGPGAMARPLGSG